MGMIAVIAPAEQDGWRWRAAEKQMGMVFGVPVLEIGVTRGRRGVRAVRRILKKQAVSAVVVRRGLPQEILAAVQESGCCLHDGKCLLHRLYPRVMRFLCKTRGVDIQRARFAVYADKLDDETRQLVLDTAADVRFLSLVTEDAAAEDFLAQVLEQTGLALMLGDGGTSADVALVAGKAYRPGRETINFTNADIQGVIGDILLKADDCQPVDLALAEAVFAEYPQVWQQYERNVKILAFC